jgi:ribonuclease-3
VQEITQERWGKTPRYALAAERGPDHDKEFEVEIFIEDRSFGRGIGKTKKAAEQAAAREALVRLGAGS